MLRCVSLATRRAVRHVRPQVRLAAFERVHIAAGSSATVALSIPATTRASFGVYNTIDDIDRLIVGLHRVFEVLG